MVLLAPKVSFPNWGGIGLFSFSLILDFRTDSTFSNELRTLSYWEFSPSLNWFTIYLICSISILNWSSLLSFRFSLISNFELLSFKVFIYSSLFSISLFFSFYSICALSSLDIVMSLSLSFFIVFTCLSRALTL